MKRKKRYLSLGLVIALLGVLVLGVSFALAAQKSVSIPKMMTWTSYDVGSSGYLGAGHISATIYEKYGTKIRVIPAGTDIPRVYPVRLKDADVAFHGLGTYFMQEGTYDFKTMDWGPQPVRAIYFCQHPGLNFVIRGDSDIKSFRDMKGKRIAAYPSGTLNLVSETYLAFAGLSWDDVVKVTAPGYSAAIRMVMEGKLDASVIDPTSSFAYEMEAMPYGIRYIELPRDYKEGWARAKKKCAAFVYFKATLGAGLSKEKPLETFSHSYPICMAYDFLPEERAYIITKLLHEMYPEYAKRSKSLANYWTPDGSLRLFDDYPLPMHRGSIRYFKEIGKWTSEREAKNQKWLQHQAELKKLWDATMNEALEKKIKSKKFPAFWLKRRAEAGF